MHIGWMANLYNRLLINLNKYDIMLKISIYLDFYNEY